MDLPITYSFRASAIEKERTLTLEDSSLVIQQGERTESVAYRDIKSIRLFYDPDRFNLNKYICEITDKKGGTTQVKSVHFKSVGNFEDRSEAYKDFLLALHEKLIPLDQVAFLAGNKPGCFAGNIVIMVVSITGVGMALWYMGSAVGAHILLRLVIFMVLLFWGLRYMRKNRPKNYDPRNIPEQIIP